MNVIEGMAAAVPAPSALPALEPGEVHVWLLDLAAGPENATFGELSEADQRRAMRYVFARDRDRFVRGRHSMRALLGRYLGCPPAQVTFRFNDHGKPALDAAGGLGFNLSHSGDLGLLAVGRGLEIGVDIEQNHPKEDMRTLADSLFSAAECAALAGLDDAGLALPFLTCWTRKEAYLKALGVGLSLEPRKVHVGLEAGRARVEVIGAPAGGFVEVACLFRNAGAVASLAVVGGFSRARVFDAWG